MSTTTAKKGILVTQARGIPEEQPFIATHIAYADRHGLEHRVISDIDFPEWMSRFANPYKFGKPFIMRDVMAEPAGAEFMLFAESDVMLTNIDAEPPTPREGHWLRSGTCRNLDGRPAICPCVFSMVLDSADAAEFIQRAIDRLRSGQPDVGPFDEQLFHDVRAEKEFPAWDLDSTLCSYHTAKHRDFLTRPWRLGDFALHVSGTPWDMKLYEARRAMSRVPTSPGVSAVVASCDRTDRLLVSLPSWLRCPLIDEIIVVDWSTQDGQPVAEALDAMMAHYSKLRVVTASGEQHFNLGAAYNLGFKLARFDLTLKLDVDYLLLDQSLLSTIMAARASGQFTSVFGTGHHIQKDRELNGLIVAHTDTLREVGYREDFVGYGYDDDDIYERLASAGAKRELIRGLGDAVIHLPHSDAARTQRYPVRDREQAWLLNQQRRRRPQELPNIRWEPMTADVRRIYVKRMAPAKSQALMPMDAYAEIFEPYRGKKVGLITPIGNVGDTLIYAALSQLAAYYNIETCELTDPAQLKGSEFAAVFHNGGGSMGNLYSRVIDHRRQWLTLAREHGIETVILPQSYNAPDDTDALADKIYLRDEQSMKFAPQRAVLAHDLALAWSGPVYRTAAQLPHGVLMRWDDESLNKPKSFAGDPAYLRSTPEGYVSLASCYETITTDRLHFAIAGLLAGVRVRLVDNSYGKNFAVYQRSLKAYDRCEFIKSTTPYDHANLSSTHVAGAYSAECECC